MKNKIRERRIKIGLSQDQLAEKAGVTRAIISQLENGTRTVITAGAMVNIAKALRSSVADVF